VEVELYAMHFYRAVVKVYDRLSNYAADGIFGNPYSVHLRYEVGHDNRWPSSFGLFWAEINKYFKCY